MGVLLVGLLIEILVRAADALSIATIITLMVGLVGLTAVELWLARTRCATTSEAVHRAAGLTLSRRESARLLSAIGAITSHVNGRDVRELPSEIEIALAHHPGTRLRLEYRPTTPHYAAVVISGE